MANNKLRTEAFTASTTWTAPHGVTFAWVRGTGGGGGGGGGGGQDANGAGYGGGGGGGSGEVEVIQATVPGVQYTLTIGAGGAGGSGGSVGSTSGSNGVGGGDTLFISASQTLLTFSGAAGGGGGFISGTGVNEHTRHMGFFGSGANGGGNGGGSDFIALIRNVSNPNHAGAVLSAQSIQGVAGGNALDSTTASSNVPIGGCGGGSGRPATTAGSGALGGLEVTNGGVADANSGAGGGGGGGGSTFTDGGDGGAGGSGWMRITWVE